MSSPERKRGRATLRAVALGAGLLALAAVSACTVRPLYSNAASPDPSTTSATGLPLISIKPEETRYGQEVRNHLIFLLNGGAGQPAAARYTLRLGVTSIDTSVAIIQVVDEDRPTAGSVTVASSYSVTDTVTGNIVASGRRNISASYDRPSQEFAALRARRDAENRAARELAELLRIAIAQKLERPGTK